MHRALSFGTAIMPQPSCLYDLLGNDQRYMNGVYGWCNMCIEGVIDLV